MYQRELQKNQRDMNMWFHQFIIITSCILANGQHNPPFIQKTHVAGGVETPTQKDIGNAFIINIPDSSAEESSIAVTPWLSVVAQTPSPTIDQSETYSTKPTDNIEVFRSIELDFNANSNHTEENISDVDPQYNDSTVVANTVLSPLFNPPEGIPFNSEDAFIPTPISPIYDQDNHDSCNNKDIVERSVNDADDISEKLDFHARLLLGRALVRKDESKKYKYYKELRETRPTHVAVYPKPFQSPINNFPIRNSIILSQLLSKNRQRNLGNQTNINFSNNMNDEVNVQYVPQVIGANMWFEKQPNDLDVSSKGLTNRKRKYRPLVTHWDFGRKTSNATLLKRPTNIDLGTGGDDKETYTNAETENFQEINQYQSQHQDYEHESNGTPVRTVHLPSRTEETLQNSLKVQQAHPKEVAILPWSMRLLQKHHPAQVIVIQPYSPPQQRPHAPVQHRPQVVSDTVLTPPQHWQPLFLHEGFLGQYPILIANKLPLQVPGEFRQNLPVATQESYADKDHSQLGYLHEVWPWIHPQTSPRIAQQLLSSSHVLRRFV